jgi:hypothetical protein
MSLSALRQISQNREVFFKQKQKENLNWNPVLQSRDNGPTLHRDQIMGAMKFINDKINFLEQSKTIPQYSPTIYTQMDLVVVMVLTSPAEIWVMILKILMTYRFKKIVVVWSSDKDWEDIQKIDNPIFQWVYQSTGSLNQLWQSGVNEAAMYQSEAIILMGSQDLVSYQYCQEAMKKVRDGFELIGSRNWLEVYLQDMDSQRAGRPDLVRYAEYNDKRADGEFIGSGRVISKYLLDKMKWQLFAAQRPLSSGVDKHSYYLMKQHQPKMYKIPLHQEMDLAIIQLDSKRSEQGDMLDPRRPGNAWMGAMIEKTRYVDYVVSLEVYQIVLKVVYRQFGGYFNEIRDQLN